MIKMRSLIIENLKSDCFGKSYHYVKDMGGILVHGKVISNGKTIDHAWVENGDIVIDPTVNVTLPISKYYNVLHAKPEAKYTSEQAMINMVRTRNMGPWTKEEVGNRHTMTENITDNPEFKRWFGDSEVVDNHGNPLLVYHLSKTSFKVFDPKKKTDLSSMGFHFGTKEQAAFRLTQYDFQGSNPSTGVYFLSIKNPLEVSHMASFAPDHLADKMMDLGMLSEDQYGKIRDRFFEEPKVGMALVKILQKNGYDGLKYKNEREGEGFSYVPFESTQIKSAIGNNGKFNPHDPDITKENI